MKTAHEMWELSVASLECIVFNQMIRLEIQMNSAAIKGCTSFVTLQNKVHPSTIHELELLGYIINVKDGEVDISWVPFYS
jgi:hypothetical protein